MQKVLLFGGTGNLGKAIANEVKKQGYHLTSVVRDEKKAKDLEQLGDLLVKDVSDLAAIKNICKGFDIVISSLGKSVSPNDKSKPSFRDIDYTVNSNVLEDAVKNGVQKFIYVSAYHSEKYLHLEYFKVHHDVSEKIKASGINYSIIKPPAIFCSLIDVIDMAKKGSMMSLGKGDCKTNPIYEGDLAKICVDAIKENNTTVEAGGKTIYSRRQLLEIIKNEVNPQSKIRTVPIGAMKFSLGIIRLFNKNMYDKFSFFTEVMRHETIAPQLGEMRFEDYVKIKK